MVVEARVAVVERDNQRAFREGPAAIAVGEPVGEVDRAVAPRLERVELLREEGRSDEVARGANVRRQLIDLVIHQDRELHASVERLREKRNAYFRNDANPLSADATNPTLPSRHPEYTK